MELRGESQKDAATLYAHIIVGWHFEFGTDERQRRFGDDRTGWLARYQHTVASFRNSDLSNPAVQLAIANEQISGSMEWAYGVSVPEQLPGVESERQHLGGIARKLRDLASQSEEEARHCDDGRTEVRFSDRETLFAKAREIYSPVAGADVQGAGGMSFLLSCSRERSGDHDNRRIVLLSPEILGVSPAPRGREGDLLEQLWSEGLEILDVTGS
jgi:hypothetical protein